MNSLVFHFSDPRFVIGKIERHILSEIAESKIIRYQLWNPDCPDYIYAGWCILNCTTAIPHMVRQGDAPGYFLHVILLIWNILTCTTKVMSTNKLGKICDVMRMASKIVKKLPFHQSSVFCEKFSWMHWNNPESVPNYYGLSKFANCQKIFFSSGILG